MRRITCLLVIALLCGGVSSLRAEETAGDEAQAKIKALERELAVLKRALAYFQKRSQTKRARASDTKGAGQDESDGTSHTVST